MIIVCLAGSGGRETEILLETPETLVSQIEDLCKTLTQPVSSYVRNNEHEFVCQYKHPDYYLSRCFASLFPYGRGCPSDKSCRSISVAKHIKHMLCMGGGPHPRRFQQSSKYIFSCYTMEMKRKMGGVAYIAQRKNLDGSSMENEISPNVSDINKLLSYLNDSSSDEQSSNYQKISDANIDPSVSSSSVHDEREMQKLIKRLIPFSKSLQGTAPHIAYERSKLMAMIPSPIISNLGLWRLFFTVAPADLYENRFYELVHSPVVDDSSASWLERASQV